MTVVSRILELFAATDNDAPGRGDYFDPIDCLHGGTLIRDRNIGGMSEIPIYRCGCGALENVPGTVTKYA